MRHNWKNLSFDLRENQPQSEDSNSLILPPQEELDLDSYVQAEEEADEAEIAVVEENEPETIETVKQVLRSK